MVCKEQSILKTLNTSMPIIGQNYDLFKILKINLNIKIFKNGF